MNRCVAALPLIFALGCTTRMILGIDDGGSGTGGLTGGSGSTGSSSGGNQDCSPSGPCDNVSRDDGGGCTHVLVANGTICLPVSDPCPSDAVCQAGVCRSHFAAATVPGQIRWQVELEPSSRGPQTVDEAGNSTWLQDIYDAGFASEAIVSLDMCGHLRWSNDAYEFFGVMQAGTNLFSYGGTPTSSDRLVSLDSASGKIRWDIDVDAALAGQDGGIPPDGGVGMLSILMSNDGLISIAVQRWVIPVFLPTELLTFNIDGAPAWSTFLPFSGYLIEAVADGEGNLYADGCTLVDAATNCVSPTLWIGSPTGQTFYESASFPFVPNLAAGSDFVAVNGFGELGPDGGRLDPSFSPLSIGCSNSQIVDRTGQVFAEVTLDGGGNALAAISPAGALGWTWPTPYSETLALSDDGTLFAFSVSTCDQGTSLPPELDAIDTDAGTLLWSTTFPGALGNFSSLALTPQGTLLATNGPNVYAIYAGPKMPSTTAPWSRDRGDNSNRDCASAPGP